MDPLAELIGQAAGIDRLRERIRQIVGAIAHARRLPPILLQGETGTGKNLVADVIHRAGPHRAGPFVDVNCAAIPEGLLEAELFGFERGAFTDARQAKAGLFQAADGGTIFLDEIAHLSDALQAKLLKVIEERTVRRLGGTRSEPVDVSIIAAANEDLVEAVAARRFRQDLFHRLAVLTLHVPALRERPDDIPLLAEHFLARACKDYGLPPKALTSEARAALRAYRWPGNVRELINVVEGAALLTEAPRIGAAELDLPADGARADGGAAAVSASLEARIEAWEREELSRALEATRWNMARAADRLGLTRGTIRYRVEKYGLRRPSRRAARRSTPPAARAAVEVSALAAARWEHRLVALLEAAVPAGDLGREFDLVVQRIESFSGRVEEAQPGRIVAAFGLEPVEDAPRRAALAALAVQKALGRTRASLDGNGATTIAIHADHCPVREISGRVQIDTGAMRRMTEALAALTARANGDDVVVSADARALLGRRFDVADPAGVDGEASGVGRLLGYHQDRFGVGGQPGPFVGRDRELEMLAARWRDARESRGQIVGVVGEPGIGKSRLLYEFRRTLDTADVIYLEGRGESYGDGVPYLPVIDLLKGYMRVDERDEPAAIGQRLVAELHALDTADVSPFLALLEAPGVAAEWLALEPAERRSRTLDALTRFVLRLGDTRPVLLAVEDLHWIDAETQAFLDRLVVSLPAARLLVLVTYRPEYGHGWAGKSCYTQLGLDPLAPRSAEALLRSIVGDDVALQPLEQSLVERTEGNPFFLEESVRTLIETRELVGERGAYRPAHDLHVLTVPPTVRAVLAARVDRLPPDEREVLQAAAVVGKDVPRGLLRAIVDVPEATLDCALTILQSGEFLHETRRVPELEYTFKHALTQEVAYGGLPTGRRRELHLRMVDALERRHADRLAEQVERLAHHALAAEAWSRALAYCRQAGAKAAWRSAHREAVQHFEQALGAVRRLPETRATLEETLDLQFQLRWSLVPLGEYAKLAESLREAEALADTLDDRPRRGEICQSMTNFLREVGDCDGARRAGERARAIGRALGDRGLEMRATYQLGMVCRQIGAYADAIDAFQAVTDFLQGELVLERFGEPSVLSVHARSWLAATLAETGRFADGIAIGVEALRIAERANNAFSLTTAHLGLGTVHARRGESQLAVPLLERGLSLCREGNFRLLLPPLASALGEALTAAARLDEALPLLEFAVDVATATGKIAGQAQYLARLGEAKLAAGRTAEASELAARALESARRSKERANEARALYLLGALAAGDPRGAAAVARYDVAMALADELGMRPLVARCHARLAGLHRRMGERDRASDHRNRAAAMLREMDMHFGLEDIDAEATPGGT